jgi:cell division septation protein DedD
MAILFTIQESVGNLVLSGTGSMDMTGFSDLGSAGSLPPYIQASGFASGFGLSPDYPATESVNTFRDSSMTFGPDTIGTGVTAFYAEILDVDSDTFGYMWNLNNLVLPTGYSGQLLNGTATITGETLTSVGITPGTYRWTAGNGDYVELSAFAEPEPTPTPTPTSTSTPTPTASATPTPTSTSTPTPTSTSTPTPTPSSSPVTTTTTTEPMIVKSANTEYVECRICDDVAQTQNTPHPVYTDNKGNEVIQMNAVVIGGNGLNA